MEIANKSYVFEKKIKKIVKESDIINIHAKTVVRHALALLFYTCFYI